MTSSTKRSAVHSVLVAFDDATIGHETMEAAVNLAIDLEAELQGLYIEDEMLLQIAELPFVQEVTKGSGTIRPIDARSMLQAMQQKAEQVRRMLEHEAKSAQIPCSFSVARGRTMRHALISMPGSDILFFGCHSHASSVRRPMALRPKSVARPLLLLVDNSSRGADALAAASTVARNQRRPIVLLVLAHSQLSFQQLSTAASQLFCDQELPHTLLPFPITTASALIQSARDQHPGLLLLSRECPLISEATIESLVDHLDCPLVLV